MSALSLSRILGRHHMAISYQENGADESASAREWLAFAMGPFGDDCDKALAVRYQQRSAMEYAFARARMGLPD